MSGSLGKSTQTEETVTRWTNSKPFTIQPSGPALFAWPQEKERARHAELDMLPSGTVLFDAANEWPASSVLIHQSPELGWLEWTYYRGGHWIRWSPNWQEQTQLHPLRSPVEMTTHNNVTYSDLGGTDRGRRRATLHSAVMEDFSFALSPEVWEMLKKAGSVLIRRWYRSSQSIIGTWAWCVPRLERERLRRKRVRAVQHTGWARLERRQRRCHVGPSALRNSRLSTKKNSGCNGKPLENYNRVKT